MITRELVFRIFIGCIFIIQFCRHYSNVFTEGEVYIMIDKGIFEWVVNTFLCAIDASLAAALIGSIAYLIFM